MTGLVDVGFPADSTDLDRRTLLTPPLAEVFRRAGVRPVAQAGAGRALGLRDEDLGALGVVFADRADVLGHRLLLKYKSFGAPELADVDEGTVLGAVFHVEAKPELAGVLRTRRLRAYSYEFLEDADGAFPLMRAGGRIAGIQSVHLAARALQWSPDGPGPGILLGPGSGGSGSGGRPGVVIIGTGNVAGGAADTALGLGARVTMLARTDDGARRARLRFPDATVLTNDASVLDELLPTADVVVGAILVSTFDTPPMIERRHLPTMRPGSVIVDATCGYGEGYLPTAGPLQQLGDPPLVVDGIQHIKIDTLPAAVPLTASYAYSRAAAPYLATLARAVAADDVPEGWSSALISDGGQIVHPVALHTLSHFEGAA